MISRRALGSFFKTPILVIVLTVSPIILAQQQPIMGQVPVMTRFMKVFMEQETQLMQAVQDKNSAQLEKLLDSSFEMRTSQRAGVPVPRAEWMKSAVEHASGEYTVTQMAVQEIGNVAIASFVLNPSASSKGTASAAFIVDTWVPEGEGWKLRVRYASPVGGTTPRASRLMGDAPVQVDAQKKY